MQYKDEYQKLRNADYLNFKTLARTKLNYSRRYKDDKKSKKLVFTYIIPTDALQMIDDFYGLSKFGEGEFSETDLSSFQPIDVSEEWELDFEKNEIEADICNPNFKFITRNINRRLVQEQDYSYESEEMFKIVKALIPKVQELKRVVFTENLYSSSPRVELSLMVMPVVFFIDSWTTNKLTAKNLKDFVLYVPLSRHLVWYELTQIFDEMAKTKWHLQSMDTSNSLLRLLPEGLPDELDWEEWAEKVVKGNIKTRNLKLSQIESSEFNASNAFLFHIKDNSKTAQVKFGNRQVRSKAAAGGVYVPGGSTTAKSYSSGYSLTGSRRNNYGAGSHRYTSYKEDFENNITEAVTSAELNDGLVGFKNIGNTCYMNSAMQCLIHLPFLREFILRNDWVNMINDDNPIGTNGDMIKSLAALIKDYYTTKSGSIAPYTFKRCVSKYMTAFEGYSHHDSQEFLSQMLDKCHEDVNQILKKPYIEMPTLKPGEKSDNQLAREAWIRYLRRNNSYFVHNFFGQFKSRIRCPICHSEYLKFDEFQVVSLPVPSLNSSKSSFYFILKDQKVKAIKLEVKVKSYLNFKDIKFKMLREKLQNLKIKKSEEQTFIRPLVVSFGGHYFPVYDETSFTEITFREVGDYSSDLELFVFQLNDLDLELLYGKGRRLKRGDYDELERIPDSPTVDKREMTANYNNEDYLSSRKDLILVGCVFKYDYYDEQSELYNELRRYRKTYIYKQTEKSPVFTKVFHASTKYTVADLYFRVWEKFYFKTKEGGGKSADPLASFRKLFKSDKMPFYIRIDGQVMTRDNWNDPLTNFQTLYKQGSVEQQLRLNVFFREGERKASRNSMLPEIEFEYYTTCQDINVDKISIHPGNLDSFENKEYNLEYLMENFSRPETLDNQNMYRCSKCKKEVKAEITMQLQKLPKVLVIFFKRIKNGYSQTNTTITYPELLDMRPFVNDKSPIESYNVQPNEILDEPNRELYLKKLSATNENNEESDSDSDSDGIDSEEDDDFSSNTIKTEKKKSYNKNLQKLGNKGPVTQKDIEEALYLPSDDIQTDLKYELVGVVDHFGSQNFGHYTCMTRVTDQQWVEFNDRTCSKINKKSISGFRSIIVLVWTRFWIVSRYGRTNLQPMDKY